MRNFTIQLSNFGAFKRRLLKLFHYLDSAPQIQETFQWLCKNKAWYYVLRARELRLKGHDHVAFVTLMLGQRCIKNDANIHLGLAALYRDDCNLSAAHTQLKVANILKPGYSTIRLLAFESDSGFVAEGSKTMESVLAFPKSITHRHVTILNRVSIFYPEHADKLDLLRLEIKRTLESCQNSASMPPSKAINLAISNRLIDTANNLRKNKNKRIPANTLELLDRLTSDLGNYHHLLELCWENETSANLTALYRNKPTCLKTLDQQEHKTVELFIPAVFFSNPDREKPTFDTVRKIFILVINYLIEVPNIVIVPRFQLYWNQCTPKTKDCYVISYHTSARYNPRHIHIQESPLAERCSFDGSGFAGHSSIAADYSVIKTFTNNIPDQTLRHHQDEIYKYYVSGNISKYFQPLSDEIYSEPYVFVVLQIPTDIVSRLAYIDGTEMLRTVVDHYRGTDTKVIVKRHPFCGSMKVAKLLDKLEAEGEIIRTNNSIHAVIKHAKLIVTVNSGVGIEALVQGKTVIVTGACEYMYAAFPVKNSVELRDALSFCPVPNDRLIREFLYFYFHQFTFSFKDRDKIFNKLTQWLK
jgi:Capsule polysaccharide biosynthesis protein